MKHAFCAIFIFQTRSSQFSPVMIFKLWEKFSDTCLEVFESMEVNGKRTFGYDVPIIYKRV